MPGGRQNNYFACRHRLRLAGNTMAAPPDDPFPPPQKLTLKPAEFERANAEAVPDEPAANDPMEMLKVNRAHEVEIGYGDYEIKPKKRFARRTKEYLLILAAGNLGIGTLFGLFGPPLMLGFTIGLTWVMFFILDDY